MQHLLTLALQHDQDVVLARQRAAQVSGQLGFDGPEQTRIATAVSEIARNAFQYAQGGSVTFALDAASRPQRLVIRISDTGPGIPHLSDVLSGRYRSATGLGLGIAGARRLMDGSRIETTSSGTTMVLEKHLTARQDPLTTERARRLADSLARGLPNGSLLEEIQQQNQALLHALDELQQKQRDLVRLNRELEDTNRGVVALYAELDEKADHLRRADELKSRFLSNMTHEFRTPVNSIIGLTTLLIEERRSEGHQPEPGLTYIRKAADQLSDLVNDLLDLAKIEAGKVVVRPAEFDVAKLVGALRGMLRPLLLNESVSLVFDVPDGLPPLYTDESKVSQVLRNLLSNALKFTERGEVRVSVTPPDDQGIIRFAVADTGIGIAPADVDRIFDEFTQLDHHLQTRSRGTGLGLPLSRRLAGLLGGTLDVVSEPDIGSTFTLALPVRYAPLRPEQAPDEWQPEAGRLPLLVVEAEIDAHYFYEKVLRSSAYQVYPAYSVTEAEAALARIMPAAILVDPGVDGGAGWNLLVRLRRNERTALTPILATGSGDDRERAVALGATGWLPKPLTRGALLDMLTDVQARTLPPTRVLVIDDEEVARYLVRQCLPVPAFEVIEAAGGAEGLRRVRAERPDVVLLDLVMPAVDGEAVLRQLRADPETAAVPVLIVTSHTLDGQARAALLRQADGVLSKADLSRSTLGSAIRSLCERRPGAGGAEPVVPAQL